MKYVIDFVARECTRTMIVVVSLWIHTFLYERCSNIVFSIFAFKFVLINRLNYTTSSSTSCRDNIVITYKVTESNNVFRMFYIVSFIMTTRIRFWRENRVFFFFFSSYYEKQFHILSGTPRFHVREYSFKISNEVNFRIHI